ncbi:hypothetical protein SDC9_172002 [bioreactor metagenome]|uniref:Uncharacterized protein n=1 Tax=bioreactor metagenome TaxID=1076179 RepID=A0A645GCG4_9ZZZZ
MVLSNRGENAHRQVALCMFYTGNRFQHALRSVGRFFVSPRLLGHYGLHTHGGWFTSSRSKRLVAQHSLGQISLLAEHCSKNAMDNL